MKIISMPHMDDINDEIEDDKDDLMKDLVAVITSFCCRLYGLRRGHSKAKEVGSKCVEPAS